MTRQSLLSQHNAPTLHAIVDEMALHRPIGQPGVMERQLQNLLTCIRRPNITVQVVPFSAGATAALEGPMMIIDLVDGRSVVHLETRRAGGFLSEDAHLRATKLLRRRLRDVALAPDKSMRLIAAIARDTTRGVPGGHS